MSTTNNLKQIGIAGQSYHDAYSKCVHNGTNTANFNDWCWAFHILPYIEQDAMYKAAIAGAPPANIGVKTYMCPGRGRQQFCTAGANSPGFQGPFTDYKMNWVSFDNRSNSPAQQGRLTMSQITSQKGTAHVIFVGEGYLNPNEYRRNHGSNWEEVIYSGGYGGTGRGSTEIRKDDVNIGQGDRWGSPFTGGCPFAFVDGSVRFVNYSFSGSTAFFAALRWNSTNPVTLD